MWTEGIASQVVGSGTSRATAGPGKLLSRGPITMTQPHSVCTEKCGEASPQHPTRGLGERSRRKFSRSHSGVWGRARILCIFDVRKKPSGTPFSVFLSIAGPGKTFPLSSPLDGPGWSDKFRWWKDNFRWWNARHRLQNAIPARSG